MALSLSGQQLLDHIRAQVGGLLSRDLLGPTWTTVPWVSSLPVYVLVIRSWERPHAGTLDQLTGWSEGPALEQCFRIRQPDRLI